MTRLLTLLLCLPLTAWAAPTSVTLFPASAQIEERTPLTARNTDGGFASAMLILPGQADPATLRFGRMPAGATVADVSWTTRTEENQTALAPLTARLTELKTERDAVAAELEGVRGRLAFWKAQTNPSQQNLAALRELANEIGATVHAQTAKAQQLEQRGQDLTSRIAKLEAEIAAAAGQRTVWDVTVLFAGQMPAELEYAYTLQDCGWEPVYRIEAQPAAGSINFAWQARIWQRSGQDWKNVAVHLATMPPDSQTQPAELRPWEIRPMQILTKAMPAPAMMAMRADSAEAVSAPLAPMPQETRFSTYSSWDMGVRTLPAGAARVLDIEHETWPATFVRLLRPSLDPKAYIQGTANFDKPRDLPQGQAFFLIDGAVIDQRQFELSGRNATLFFGADPLLSCAISLKDKKTGDKGLLKTKQTFVREWTMTVHNAGKTPTQFRLEEPRPQLRDERIALDVGASPAPAPADENKPEIMTWSGNVPPGGDQLIKLRVQFEAPEELHIDPGWRW